MRKTDMSVELKQLLNDAFRGMDPEIVAHVQALDKSGGLQVIVDCCITAMVRSSRRMGVDVWSSQEIVPPEQ